MNSKDETRLLEHLRTGKGRYKLWDCNRNHIYRNFPKASYFMVWHYFFTHESDEQEMWQSNESVAEGTGLSLATVKRSKKWLIENHWLVPVGGTAADKFLRPTKGAHQVLIYRVDDPTKTEKRDEFDSTRIQLDSNLDSTEGSLGLNSDSTRSHSESTRVQVGGHSDSTSIEPASGQLPANFAPASDQLSTGMKAQSEPSTDGGQAHIEPLNQEQGFILSHKVSCSCSGSGSVRDTFTAHVTAPASQGLTRQHLESPSEILPPSAGENQKQNQNQLQHPEPVPTTKPVQKTAPVPVQTMPERKPVPVQSKKKHKLAKDGTPWPEGFDSWLSVERCDWLAQHTPASASPKEVAPASQPESVSNPDELEDNPVRLKKKVPTEPEPVQGRSKVPPRLAAPASPELAKTQDEQMARLFCLTCGKAKPYCTCKNVVMDETCEVSKNCLFDGTFSALDAPKLKAPAKPEWSEPDESLGDCLECKRPVWRSAKGVRLKKGCSCAEPITENMGVNKYWCPFAGRNGTGGVVYRELPIPLPKHETNPDELEDV